MDESDILETRVVLYPGQLPTGTKKRVVACLCVLIFLIVIGLYIRWIENQ